MRPSPNLDNSLIKELSLLGIKAERVKDRKILEA